MKKHLNFAGWYLLAIIILTGALYAGSQGAPFHVLHVSGRSLFQIDTNGRPVFSNTSTTTAEGVSQGFVTGSAGKEHAALFKNNQGTAVAMPDTNYTIFVSVEEATGVAGAAEPTAIISKSTAGFTIQTDNNLTTDHTLRWFAIRR